MSGFFFNSTAGKKSKSDIRSSVSKDTLHALQCAVCPLKKYHDELASPDMQPSGNPKADLYILAEAPGATEDEQGEPLVGRSGEIIKKVLASGPALLEGKKAKDVPKNKAFVQCLKHYRFNNVVRTRPPNNRTPSPIEIECCRPSVIKDIEEVKPKVILALGATAFNWLTSETAIGSWRGRIMPVKVGNHVCWAVPTYHPSYILRNQRGRYQSDEELLFERDVYSAMALSTSDDDPNDAYVDVGTVYEDTSYIDGSGGKADLQRLQRHLTASTLTALDIETSRLRPYETGAKILTVAVANHEHTLSFALHHPQNKWGKLLGQAERLFEDYLYDDSIRKVCQNLTFELEYFCYFYDAKALTVNWHMWEDTLAQAYVFDYRRGANDLESLCVWHLGLPLKKLSKLDKAKLENEPLDAVLRYNGLDSKYTLKVFDIQAAMIKGEELDAVYREQIRRVPSAVLIQLKGTHVDQKESQRYLAEFTAKIETIMEEVAELPAVKKFNRDLGREFKIGSQRDVGYLLHHYYGEASVLATKTAANPRLSDWKTDDEILSKLEMPVAKKVLAYRNLDRLVGTYVVPFLAPDGHFLFPDGKLHTQYSTTFTITRRLSSRGPNQQNWPKRDNPEIRSQIVPAPGHVIVCVDYGQLEARILCCASKDARYSKALWDDYDVHMVWAERIAQEYPDRIGGKDNLTNKGIMKKLRTDVKNQFTFPLFYGARNESVANYLQVPPMVMDPIIGEFWDYFNGVRTWQKGQLRFYHQNGYLESLTGFRYRAPLRKNELLNYVIQGSSSDLVVDAMNRLSERARISDEYWLQPIMNIHDDLTFEVPEDKLDDALETIITFMLDFQFPFISVPLAVEVSLGYENWFAVEEIGVFRSDQWLK